MLLTGAICTLTIGIPPSFVKFNIFRKDTVEGFSAEVTMIFFVCESILTMVFANKSLPMIPSTPKHSQPFTSSMISDGACLKLITLSGVVRFSIRAVL